MKKSQIKTRIAPSPTGDLHIDTARTALFNYLFTKQIEVVRLKNPNKKVEFDDIIRGKIKFDTTELGNFVIAKNINEPLYHLAVVVDDYEMEISHIIRGEDHISNTPRQILI